MSRAGISNPLTISALQSTAACRSPTIDWYSSEKYQSAREYRIPAVVLTKNATTEIKKGQAITVGGDKGIVELND